MLLSPIRKWADWLQDSMLLISLFHWSLQSALWDYLWFLNKWHLENSYVLSYWSPHAEKNWSLPAILYVKYCCYFLSEVLRRDVLPSRKFSIAQLPQLKIQSQVSIPCHLIEYGIYRKKTFSGCGVKVWNDECIFTWNIFFSNNDI